MYLAIIWLSSAVCLWSSHLQGLAAKEDKQTNKTISSTKEIHSAETADSGETSQPRNSYQPLDNAILRYLQLEAESPGFSINDLREDSGSVESEEADLRDWKRGGHVKMHFGKRGEDNNELEEDYNAKRGHSLMHFGKREDNNEREEDYNAKRGHSLMHFGKRDDDSENSYEEEKRAGHSLMHFGKREEDSQGDKRGHRLMHFGKRDDEDYQGDKRGGHSLMHFGKRDDSEEYSEEKRAGHSLMHFGKRNSGHRVMHFGKREDPDVEFDKRAGHSLMHFGKRGGHSLMHFGKRNDDDADYDKRGGHSLMHFGKRQDDSEDNEKDEYKRAGHSLMHFGKRSEKQIENEIDDVDEKRAGHSLMHFGKRSANYFDDDSKRAGHSLMHFGKRTEPKLAYDPKRGHSLMHFGKRSEGTDEKSFQIQNKSQEDLIVKASKKNSPNKATRQEKNVTSAQKTETSKVRITRSVHPFNLEYYQNPFFRAFIRELMREQTDDTKRDNKMLRFAKSGTDHGFIHFGKRGNNHALMHFGKRLEDEERDQDEQEEDLNFDYEPESEEEDINQNELYTDYNQNDEDAITSEAKRAGHSMLHFGRKRGDNRNSHAMLHFGKRDQTWGDSSQPLRDNQGYLNFGKRNQPVKDLDEDENSYAASYYRKRPSAGHQIMRFGKRSISEEEEKDKENSVRKRRYASFSEFFRGWPGTELTGRTISSPAGLDSSSTSRSQYLLPRALSAAEMSTMHVPLFMGHLNRIQRAAYPYYGLVNKKDHKNIFLHFGKR